MAKTAVLVALLAVVIGGAVLVWAPSGPVTKGGVSPDPLRYARSDRTTDPMRMHRLRHCEEPPTRMKRRRSRRPTM